MSGVFFWGGGETIESKKGEKIFLNCHVTVSSFFYFDRASFA